MSDAQDDFNHFNDQANKTFNNVTHTISTGLIVGIVIIVLAVIVTGVFAIWLLKRNQRRRRQREEKVHNGPSGSSGYGYAGGYQNVPSDAQQIQRQMQQHQQSPWQEVHGPNPPSRYEVPDTGLPYPEAPDTMTPKQAPPYESNGPRSELSGIDSGRRELPA
ncbi:hypothetical protein HD806DRAFT_534945 [Xylariaceae sp. AK1471]|nr:hypothetical protein HD806DRAFT_534945 [Xylariaceae sp. AK1471]